MRIRQSRDGLLRLTYSPVTPDQVDVIEFHSDSGTISITSGASGVTYTLARPTDSAGDYQQRADLQPILGVSLPTDTRTVIVVLGEPDESELLPVSEPSPAGQYFCRNPGPKYNTVVAFGGDYSPATPNYRAGVGLFGVRANKRGAVAETIHGFKLNRTTREEVERSFVGLWPNAFAEGEWPGEGDYFRSALAFFKNDLYTYFLLDAHDRLVGVAQATFPVDGV